MADTNSEMRQLYESLQGLYEITARADERLKLIVGKQSEVENKIEKYASMHAILSERLIGLESKSDSDIRSEISNLKTIFQDLEKSVHEIDIELNNVKFQASTHENRWQKALDILVQVGIVVAAALIIYRLGIEV